MSSQLELFEFLRIETRSKYATMRLFLQRNSVSLHEFRCSFEGNWKVEVDRTFHGIFEGFLRDFLGIFEDFFWIFGIIEDIWRFLDI